MAGFVLHKKAYFEAADRFLGMGAGALGGVHDETSFWHKWRFVRIWCGRRPVPADRETRFTFHDGRITNERVYTFIEPPPIPTTSGWGMFALVLLVVVPGRPPCIYSACNTVVATDCRRCPDEGRPSDVTPAIPVLTAWAFV